MVDLPDQFELDYGTRDLGPEFERLPRLVDIRKDLPAIDCLGERAHVGIAGHHDARGCGDFSHAPQKLVPADPGHALIAQDYRHVMFQHQLECPLAIGGRKHLVVVFEKMFKRREYERFVVQDQEFFLHLPLCTSRSSGILTMNSVPAPSSL